MVVKKLLKKVFSGFLNNNESNGANISNKQTNIVDVKKKEYKSNKQNSDNKNSKNENQNKAVADQSSVNIDNYKNKNIKTKKFKTKFNIKTRRNHIWHNRILFTIGFLIGIVSLFLLTKMLVNYMFTSYRNGDNLMFKSEYFLDDYDDYIKPARKYGKEYGSGNLELTLKYGESLSTALQKLNFDYNEIVKIIELLKDGINLKNLKTGQVFRIAYSFEIVAEPIDAKRTKILYPQKHQNKEYRHIENFHFKTNNGAKYNISRNNDGFLLHSEQPKLITKRHMISGTITTSLFADVLVSDIKPSTLYNALNEYAFLIDFQRDLHKNDKFVFILDTTRDNDGDVVEEKVLYVNLILSGRNYEMFNFNNRFYNRKGNSIRRALLKTPIDGARITSGFNPNRRHPIYGYSRAHLAIDLAAPQGTPIYSAGDGVVVEKVNSGGDCGKYVKIRHNAEYSTLYCHMSRFSNVKKGQFVRQRQVIGYVGMTGAATGPHLHYAVYRHGRAINPSSIKVASTKKIESKYLEDFNYTIKNIDKILKDHM